MRFAAQRFNQDRCPQAAASLTFTTLLALVPLVTVAITVFSIFPVFNEWMTQLKLFLLSNMVPDKAGKVITVYMQQFASKAARLTLLGVGGLVITALMLMHTIGDAFNAIWRVHRPRSLLARVLIYWAVLTVGPILLGASLSITYYLLGYTKGVPLLGASLLKLTPWLLMSTAFTLLYYAVPNRHVPFKHALIGGVVAGVLFELMKQVFTWYITTFTTYRMVYGTFAVFPVFLLWIYLSWMIVLLGAELAALLSHWRGASWYETQRPGWRFGAALRLLLLLAGAQHTGHGTTLAWLRKQLDLGLDDVEDLLEQLRRAHYVRRAEKGNWRLARAPAEIVTGDLFRLFAFNPVQEGTQAIQPMIDRLLAAQRDALNVTLDQLVEQK